MKFVITILSFLFLINTGMAQSTKFVDKANEKIAEINAYILDTNPDLGLNEEQINLIREKLVQKAKDSKVINKSDATDEEKRAEKKVLNKKVFSVIHKEIMTKEQRKAFTAGKQKSKEKK